MADTMFSRFVNWVDSKPFVLSLVKSVSTEKSLLIVCVAIFVQGWLFYPVSFAAALAMTVAMMFSWMLRIAALVVLSALE